MLGVSQGRVNGPSALTSRGEVRREPGCLVGKVGIGARTAHGEAQTREKGLRGEAGRPGLTRCPGSGLTCEAGSLAGSERAW